MSRIDRKGRHIRGYSYISDKSYLFKTSGKPWKNFLFFMSGCMSFIASYAFFAAYPEEGGIGLIFASLLGIILGVCLLAYRKTILISNRVLKITYYLNLFGSKKIIRVWERPLSYFDSAVVRWDQVTSPSGDSSTYGSGTLYLENDGVSVDIFGFSLRGNGQDLFLDIMNKLEKITGIHIRVKDRKLYGLERR